MGWFGKKLDSLAGTIVALISGLTSLQLPAFMHAYVQRLGGHLDEARLGLAAIKTGHAGHIAGNAALRDNLTMAAQARVDYLEAAQSAISGAGSFERPFVFFGKLDRDIALATAHDFTPALPLDLPSLVFALVGIVLGFLVWGAVKSPARLLRRRKHRTEQA